MTTTPAGPRVDRAQAKPGLIFFHSGSSGRCRRVEGFLAQVLQRRRNHDTFRIYRVDVDARPEIAERFGIETTPAILVVEENAVRKRVVAPRGCREIEAGLADWLR